MRRREEHSETATTTTTLSASGIRWHGSDVLDTTDLHSRASEGSEGGLSTGTRRTSTDAASGAEADVKSVDSWGKEKENNEISRGSDGRNWKLI